MLLVPAPSTQDQAPEVSTIHKSPHTCRAKFRPVQAFNRPKVRLQSQPSTDPNSDQSQPSTDPKSDFSPSLQQTHIQTSVPACNRPKFRLQSQPSTDPNSDFSPSLQQTRIQTSVPAFIRHKFKFQSQPSTDKRPNKFVA